jgi:hypothetical protein
LEIKLLRKDNDKDEEDDNNDLHFDHIHDGKDEGNNGNTKTIQ